jgi:uncharacterized protein (DUF488 family)
MKLFTIGFTKKSAESFFTKLKNAGVKRLVDIRLNNVSQLAGFSKRDDLAYFSRTINHISYIHLPQLAPTQELLDDYKKKEGSWEEYQRRFIDLVTSRRIEEHLVGEIFDGDCLLCSEDKPHHCHRRLVAEYLKERWPNLQIEHIY